MRFASPGFGLLVSLIALAFAPSSAIAQFPAISKTFGASAIPLNGSTTLTFTVETRLRRYRPQRSPA